MVFRANTYVRAKFVMECPWKSVVLESSERHVRRKLISLEGAEGVLVDFAEACQLEHHDCLVIEDGRLIQVIAGAEELMEVKAQSPMQLAQLSWHIGNRHLEAQIESGRILIRPDHVIAHMLEHLGAVIRNVREPFSPERGAYHSHAHGAGSHSHGT